MLLIYCMTLNNLSLLLFNLYRQSSLYALTNLSRSNSLSMLISSINQGRHGLIMSVHKLVRGFLHYVDNTMHIIPVLNMQCISTGIYYGLRKLLLLRVLNSIE